MKIFRLQWGDWEMEENYFFYGPNTFSEEDFVTLAESLKSQAIDNAMKASGHKVGWKHIVQEIALLLQDNKFVMFTPLTVSFVGPSIIDEHDQDGLSAKDYKKILEFNQEAHKRYWEQFPIEEE